MADERDHPSLELPSLFRRRGQRRPRPVGPGAEPRGEPRVETARPARPPLPAALLTGALIGLVASGLVWLAVAACASLRGTSSCGGPGIVVLLAILVAMVLLGRALLGVLGVPDAGSTASLAVALVALVALLFVEELDGPSGAAILAVLGAAAFGAAQWVTSSNTSPGERPR